MNKTQNQNHASARWSIKCADYTATDNELIDLAKDWLKVSNTFKYLDIEQYLERIKKYKASKKEIISALTVFSFRTLFKLDMAKIGIRYKFNGEKS